VVVEGDHQCAEQNKGDKGNEYNLVVSLCHLLPLLTTKIKFHDEKAVSMPNVR
jgi:hypothetical protein